VADTSSFTSGEVVVGTLVLALLLVGWFLALRDLARRDDLGVAARVVWVVVVLVLGLLGVVVYFLLRPRDATQAERDARAQMSDEFVERYSAPPADDRAPDDPPQDDPAP
jgi:hypothetical protein